MPVPIYMLLLTYLTSFAATVKDATVATACSGTDIGVKVLARIGEFWRRQHGLHIAFEHILACDKDAAVQYFLREQLPALKMLVGDVMQLGQMRAQCLMTLKQVVVQGSTLFAAGFSCKSRSPQSVNRADNKHCLREAKACETTITFDQIFAYIKSFHPLIVILENVKELLEKTAEGLCDAEWIIEQFKTAGYGFAAYYIIEARDHGSLPRRRRLYFIAVDIGAKLLPHITQITSFATSLIAGMQTGPGQPEDYIDMWITPSASDERRSKLAKVDKGDCNLKCSDEHFEIFAHNSLVWPPEFSTFFCCIFDRFTDRQLEVLYLLHRVFPMSTDPGCSIEFVDVNNSLPRLLGWPATHRNPWSQACPTLTCNTVIAMRYDCKGETVIRAATGKELMGMIGWTADFWHDGTDPKLLTDDSLLTKMAGNAFSGFAFGVAATVGMALAGMKEDHFVASKSSATSQSTPRGANLVEALWDGGDDDDDDDDADDMGSSYDDSDSVSDVL